MDELTPGTAKARALLDAGRPAEALAAVSPDLASNPQNFEALCAAAEAKMMLGDADEAVGLVQQAIAVRPGDERTFRLLASSYMVSQKLGPARDAAQRAVELSPNNWLAHLARASVDVRGRRLSPQSIYSAEVAVQLAPQQPEAHVVWGQVLQMDGSVVEAKEQFQEALRLDPHNRGAMMGLGISNLRSGDQAAASRAFVDILATDSDSFAAAFNLRVSAGRIVRGGAWLLLALTAIGWVFVVAVSLAHIAGSAERVHYALIVTAALTLVTLAIGTVRMRQVVGHRFFRFTRSILRIDRLLALWMAMLVVVLGLSIWAIWLPAGTAGWMYFLALAIVGGGKYVESERNKRLIIERRQHQAG